MPKLLNVYRGIEALDSSILLGVYSTSPSRFPIVLASWCLHVFGFAHDVSIVCLFLSQIAPVDIIELQNRSITYSEHKKTLATSVRNRLPAMVGDTCNELWQGLSNRISKITLRELHVD